MTSFLETNEKYMHPLERANPTLYKALFDDEEFYKSMVRYAKYNWYGLGKLGGYSPRDLVHEAMCRIIDERRAGVWNKQEWSPRKLVENTIDSIADHEYNKLKGTSVSNSSFDQVIKAKGASEVYDNLIDILKIAISKLPSNDHQQIAFLKYINEESQTNIAKVIRKSDSYVSKALEKIDEYLRKCISAEISKNQQKYDGDDIDQNDHEGEVDNDDHNDSYINNDVYDEDYEE